MQRSELHLCTGKARYIYRISKPKAFNFALLCPYAELLLFEVMDRTAKSGYFTPYVGNPTEVEVES
jgi:hypothetical protein